MKIFSDKYFIICLISFFLLISFSSFIQTENNDELLIGLTYNIEHTTSGYVFDFEDINGNQIHCYSKNQPVTNSVCKISGNFSDDKSIFFVSDFSLCQT